ncbi:MAG: hypothetical protein ACHP79_03975, partial [Terriglobales bacterium]
MAMEKYYTVLPRRLPGKKQAACLAGRCKAYGFFKSYFGLVVVVPPLLFLPLLAAWVPAGCFLLAVVVLGGSGCGFNATLLPGEAALLLVAVVFLAPGGNGCGLSLTLLPGEAFVVRGGNGCGLRDTLLPGDVEVFLAPGGSGCGFNATLLPGEALVERGGRGWGLIAALLPGDACLPPGD